MRVHLEPYLCTALDSLSSSDSVQAPFAIPSAMVLHQRLRQSLFVRPGTLLANSRHRRGRDSCIADMIQNQYYAHYGGLDLSNNRAALWPCKHDLPLPTASRSRESSALVHFRRSRAMKIESKEASLGEDCNEYVPKDETGGQILVGKFCCSLIVGVIGNPTRPCVTRPIIHYTMWPGGGDKVTNSTASHHARDCRMCLQRSI